MKKTLCILFLLNALSGLSMQSLYSEEPRHDGDQPHWEFTWSPENSNEVITEYPARFPIGWDNKTYYSGTATLSTRISIQGRSDMAIGLEPRLTNYRLEITGFNPDGIQISNRTYSSEAPLLEFRSYPIPEWDSVRIDLIIINPGVTLDPLTASPWIGKRSDMINRNLQAKERTGLFAGFIIIMFIYHILLWIFQRKNQSNLFFALFILAMLLRNLSQEMILFRYFPGLANIHLAILNLKLEYLCVPVGTFTFFYFLHTFFPGAGRRVMRKIFLFGCGLWSLAIILLPAPFFIQGLILYEAGVIISSLYFIFFCWKRFREKSTEALTLLIGFTLFFIFSLIEIYSINTDYQTSDQLIYGLLTIILFKASLLIKRFAVTFHQNEYLSSNLQQEVIQKTKEITAQQQQILQLQDEKIRFFINITHELRTPLTLIQNYLDQYKKTNPETPELTVISKNIKKLITDFVSLLNYEKRDRSQTPESPKDFAFAESAEPWNLKNYLEFRLPLYKEKARQANLTFRVLQDSQIWLTMHPRHFDSLIENLIENSIKFTNSGGEIQLVLTTRDSELIIRIKDTGIGIPKDQQKRILENYYRVNHKDHSKEGWGIGLNLVKKIVNQLNGSIKIDSEENRGTEISLCIPDVAETDQGKISLAEKTASEIPPASERAPEPVVDMSGIKNSRLLIIEDNRELRNYLDSELSKDYRVLTARNGKTALEMVTPQSTVDLIISDIMMPEMDGIHVLNHFMTNQELSHIPFLFLTAKTGDGDMIKGLRHGAVDYITKPFDIQSLKARIASLLALHTRQKHNQIRLMERRISETLNSQSIPVQSKPVQTSEYHLTGREKEVINLVKKGLSNKNIARELHLSPHTINTHLKNIYSKCEVTNRTELTSLFQQVTL